MRIGESGEEFYFYDLFDIKIANYEVNQSDSLNGTEFKLYNISEVYSHFYASGSGVVEAMNDTIR